MGEALIVRKGGDRGASTDIINMPPIEGLYIANGYYVCNRNGNYNIQVVGGGGGGAGAGSGAQWSRGYGGNGAKINNGSVYLNRGDVVQITVGGGGIGGQNGFKSGNTGGTTAFGTYLSAIGGNGGASLYGGGSSYTDMIKESIYGAKNNIYMDGANTFHATQNSGTSVSPYGVGGNGGYGYNKISNGTDGKGGAVSIKFGDWML